MDDGRAIIYIRVSTDRQVVQGASLENQEKSCLEWCYRNGILPVQTFKDEGKSAKNLIRPEMQRMLSYISKNHREINYLVVYQIDRLARNATDYFGLNQALGKYKIKIRDASEPLESSPANELVRGMSAVYAEFENSVKAKLVTDNMEQAATQGYRMHKAPYGLKNVRDENGKSIVEVVPETSDKIAFVLNEFSKNIYTKSGIAKKCTSIGLNQQNGKPMSIQRIDKILKNGLYAGLEKGVFTKNVYVDSKFGGIISRETFFKNQEILSGNKNKLRGTYKILNPDYPLRGFIKCIHCGRKLTGSASTGNKGKKYPRYNCNTKKCKKGFIVPQELHIQFKNLLAELKPTSKKSELLKIIIVRTWGKQSGELGRKKLEITKEIINLEEKKLSLAEKRANNEIEVDDYLNLRQKYKKTVGEFENQLLDLDKQLKLKNIDIDYALRYLANAPILWNDASTEMKVIYQNMIFPEGITYDLQKKKFGTPKLSAIYSLANIKKDPSRSEESLLVIPRRIELLLPG